MQNFIRDYGFNEDTSFNDYFNLEFSQERGVYVTAKEDALGIIPLRQNFVHPYVDLIKRFTENPDVELNIPKKENRAIAFVITPEFLSDNNHMLGIFAIKGKTNKDGTRMASHIGSIDDLQISENLSLSENQKKLNENINLLDFDKTNNQSTLEVWKEVFKLLVNEQFVFFSDTNQYQIRKKDLQDVKIGDNLIDIEFDVKETKEFIELHPMLIANGNAFSIEDRDLSKSGYFHSYIQQVLYLHGSLKVCDFIASYADAIKMPKNHFETFFDRIIRPLSEIWNFNFQTPGDYSAKTAQLSPLKKQVYLSEHNNYLVIKLQVVYDKEISCLLSSSANILELRDNKLIKFEREPSFEENFFDYVSGLHPDFESQKIDGVFYLTSEQLLKDHWFFGFFDTLQKENIEVFGLKDLKNFRYSPYKAKMQTGIKSGQDWFEVEIEVSFGDTKVSLSDVRKAVIKKQKYIQLKDGSLGILPEKWLEKLGKYFRNGEIKKGKLNISELRFTIVDELFDNIDDAEIIEEIAGKRQNLRDIGDIKSVSVPKSIKAKLRDYQTRLLAED